MENGKYNKLEELLFREAEANKPSEVELRTLLSRLQTPVTKKSAIRSSFIEDEKGRVFQNIINLLNTLMNNVWKIVLPVGLLAVVLLAIVYFRFSPMPASENNLTQSAVETTEFASADINDAVSEIAESVLGDELLAEMEAEDAIYLDYEDEALANFDNIALLYE